MGRSVEQLMNQADTVQVTQQDESDTETISVDQDVIDQYVTFYLNNEAFAFPMATVIEIVRVPETVDVPMTPTALVGLANLRGSVLTILDLRLMLSLPEAHYHEATRVIVCDVGKPVGLVVDKVSRVLNVESKYIESAEHVNASIATELLTGVAKNVGGHELIQLLDVRRVVKQTFSSKFTEQTGTQRAARVSDLATTTHDNNNNLDETRQLVSFVVDEQEYAFDIQDVEEIVRVPESVAQVPKTSHHVLGLINLRSRLLALVSLRRMFSLPEQTLDERNRILVVNLHQAGQRLSTVGIVVDQVREVLRITADIQDQVPALLRQGGECDEIGAICRLENGKRLVSVLSAQDLFHHPDIQQALEAQEKELEAGTLETTLETEHAVTEDEETQLVVFLLAEQEFAVSIDAVREITRVPERMTRVPKTPKFIEGMVNLRGAVLPVLNMRTRFGMEQIERNERQRILVLDLDGTRTGFITDAVLEVRRLSRHLIETAPHLSAEQTRIMGKVVNFRESKRMIQVLDVQQLLSDQERAAIAETV
jgi:purine-binding chemotaxis protein CheW